LQQLIQSLLYIDAKPNSHQHQATEQTAAGGGLLTSSDSFIAGEVNTCAIVQLI
jgi:hypothetical protein